MLHYILSILVVGVVFSVRVEGVESDAYIYTEHDAIGGHIVWSDTSDWSDLATVMENHGLGKYIGSVCVTGAWLLYNRQEYDSFGPADYAVLSGFNHECFPGPGAVYSMQPLGSAEFSHGVSMTLFTEKHFGGPGLPIQGSRGLRFLESMSGPPQSIVVVGKSQWTIETTSGKTVKRYCLATNFDFREPYPICMIPDLLGLALWTENATITSIGRGCEKTVQAKDVALLEDCKYWGEKRPDPNEADRYRPRVLSENFLKEITTEGPNDTSTTPPTVPPPAPENPRPAFNGTCSGGKGDAIVKEFAMLLAIRLNHDFTSHLQLLWPEPEDIHRAEILDMIWDIGMAVTPAQIVPHEYMMMLREFMVYHLSLVWKNSKNKTVPEVSEYLIKTVQKDLDGCALFLLDTADHMQQLNTEYWMQDGVKSIFEEFVRPRAIDIVIDSTYVVANMVLGVCHHLLGYSNNFWANYIHLINRYYLLPVVEDWKTMGIEEEYILGGYDFDLMYHKLAAFATNAIQMVPNLEPFERQKGVIANPTHPSKGNVTTTISPLSVTIDPYENDDVGDSGITRAPKDSDGAWPGITNSYTLAVESATESYTLLGESATESSPI